ncbi:MULTISPECIES: alanine racemase [Brevibacterium]|uniref:alanine racemase n=1 Tax=Brevibacterium TaxID=1696 RepID=UPI000DE939A0|nr:MULTISPECIES: alanine racemase [Brevibacterium]
MTRIESSGSLVRAEIDEAALRANAETLAGRLSPARLKCIVKANAYGHGIDIVAGSLFAAGWREFGVATIPEALALREILGESAVISAWLHGPETDFAPAVGAGIEIGVSTLACLDSVRDAARRAGRGARVHLKVDSGLGRNGFSPADFDDALHRLEEIAAGPVPGASGAPGASSPTGIEIVGIMSHFAVADEPERAETAEQVAVFDSARRRLRAVLTAASGRLGDPDRLDIHIANSPAALTLDPLPGTSARVGLALYGLSPLEGRTPADLGLRPVMRLVSEVVNLKHVPAGHGASYGLTYTTEHDTRFALVPGGYGDGIPRAASNRAEVAIRGRRYPVVGRIAMDQMVIDVGEGAVDLGDEVVILGPGGPSADEWATWSDTINYEIVTRISARVDRTPLPPGTR